MKVKETLLQEEVLIDLIHQIKNQIADEELKEKEFECNLWVNTDFSALKLSNADQRKAFVKKEMANYINKTAKLKNDLLRAENELKLTRTKNKLILEFGLDVLDDE